MRPTIKLIVVPDDDEFLEPERKWNEHFRFNALAGLVDDADLERPDGASRRSVAVLGDEEPLHLLSHRAEKLRKGFRQSTHCIKKLNGVIDVLGPQPFGATVTRHSVLTSSMLN